VLLLVLCVAGVVVVVFFDVRAFLETVHADCTCDLVMN
jgi:hypothetical protein